MERQKARQGACRNNRLTKQKTVRTADCFLFRSNILTQPYDLAIVVNDWLFITCLGGCDVRYGSFDPLERQTSGGDDRHLPDE
jgi:hypothetical protein